MSRMDEPPTRGEVIEMFRAMTPQLLGAVFELLGVPAVPGAAAAAKRRQQLDQGVDNQFLAARREVRKAIANPIISLGDAGFRYDDGIHKISTTPEPDDDERVGPAQRAIRRRLRRRKE